MYLPETIIALNIGLRIERQTIIQTKTGYWLLRLQ